MLVGRFSQRFFCTAAFSNPRPWLFVGLGNPGDKYTGTRHNVGFELIDAFAKSQGISMNAVHCKAIFGKGSVQCSFLLLFLTMVFFTLLCTCVFGVGHCSFWTFPSGFVHGVPVFLAKPQTFMNLSGESVSS